MLGQKFPSSCTSYLPGAPGTGAANLPVMCSSKLQSPTAIDDGLARGAAMLFCVTTCSPTRQDARSEKQKIQYKELNVKFLSELEIIKNSNKDKFEKLKDLKKVRDKRDDQLKLLLNENQFKTHKEKQKQSKVKMRGELRKCIN